MSNHTDDSTACGAVHEDLTELALGILSGRRRSETLEHVESCPRCRAELKSLSATADTLLQLAPEAEPPLGFESRLAERLHVERAGHRPDRRQRSMVLAVAAALVAVLAFGLGSLVAHRTTSNPPSSAIAAPTVARLTSHGTVLGQVLISSSRPSWMFVTVDSGTWSGEVSCEATLKSGKIVTVGWFKVSGDYSSWVAPLKAVAGEVRSVRLVTYNGTILASATIPA
jgi:anti-sigma factor RsiW